MGGGSGTGCGPAESWACAAAVRAMERARAAKRTKSDVAARRQKNERGTPILQDSRQHCTPADCCRWRAFYGQNRTCWWLRQTARFPRSPVRGNVAWRCVACAPISSNPVWPTMVLRLAGGYWM